jgi:hemerythrin-like domain-containing protein
MQLRELYQKDIFRHIEGVIKADDATNIVQEVEEYVITKELQKKLDHFFDAYTSTNISNFGVWVSGFFGSGKSHLLKILSYILENRELNGKKVGEIFLSKIDESDFELSKNIEKALKVPAQSILFNIDQKSDITSKTQPDAVLSVFMKVFNEMMGYYPKYGYVAEFERDLDKQNLYEEFKKKYEEISNEPWEKGRETIFLEITNFAKALSEVKGISVEDAAKVIDLYEEKYTLSIEDFAKKVKAYIDQQPKGFRLVFCVDEMGQYISEHTKLMLNLQTIAESLATICKGQAWIIVTSQEDIENLIGDMTARQANDFSRIQARFSTRINLSSANVDEVIQIRLLSKDNQCISALNNLYEIEKNNFKTLFHFGEGSRQFRTYLMSEHFIDTYPFVPYQFDLFQSSIRGLSRHNAFQGRHQSVGERSMLGVFQLVAQYIADEQLGRTVSYDQLFDGIRSTLRSEVQSSIINAERNLTNKFHIKVLKALFLVKYVKEFKAVTKNIVTLMIDLFDVDLIGLEKNVQEALNHLEDQTYVQQVAGIYEFLTDEEKDVENEIKATEVEPTSVRKFLADIIFSEIIRDNKIRYEENKQDYNYARKLDYSLVSREDDLAIHFITPLCDEDVNESILKASSMGQRELIIQLADDLKLKNELTLFKKTEKYIQQTSSASLSDNIKTILRTKGSQNIDRRRDVMLRVEDLITSGKFYLNGQILDLNGNQAKIKVINAFQELIKIVYPNLRMLRTIFREDDLKNILFQPQDDLLINSDETMSEAEQEMNNFITRKKQMNERPTTKSVLDQFSHAPYGWYQMGVLCVLARLYMRNKVELYLNSNLLEKKEVLATLKNNREYPNTIIEPSLVVDPKGLKDFYRDLFDETLAETELKPIAYRLKERLHEEITQINTWINIQSQYPFVINLKESVQLMSQIQPKDPYWLAKNVSEFRDKLLEKKEDLIDPIKRFMKSEQRKIYDNVIKFLTEERANLGYIDENSLQILKALKNSQVPYRGGQIKEAKAMIVEIRRIIDLNIVEERRLAQSILEETIKKINSLEGFQKTTMEERQKLLNPFIDLKEIISQEKDIPVIRDIAGRIDNRLYPQMLKELNTIISGDVPQTEEEIVSIKTIRLAFYKPTLDNIEDVNKYVDSLKRKLLEEINNNRKISL